MCWMMKWLWWIADLLEGWKCGLITIGMEG